MSREVVTPPAVCSAPGGARQHRAHFRAAVDRQVHRRPLQFDGAAFRRRLPARAPAADGEAFIQNRAEGGLAAQPVAAEGAVGRRHDLLFQIRPAAVVSVRVTDAHAAVVGDDRGLAA